jgi:hypothetical protein
VKAAPVAGALSSPSSQTSAFAAASGVAARPPSA